MKFHVLSILAIALTPSATEGLAFTSKFPNPVNFLAEKAREPTQIEVIPGVGLPTDVRNMPIGKRISNLAQGSIKTNKDVIAFLGGKDGFSEVHEAWMDANPLKPLSKTSIARRPESLLKVFTNAINNIIKVHPDDADPTEGYLYFGNRNFKKILPMLCQSNPFYASALTISEDQEHFELIAFTDEPELGDEPLYLSLMRELTDDSHNINAKFDKSMNLIEITVLDTDSGKVVVVPEEEWDYYSSGILYNVFYYSSAVHANVHILHYLMCAGIVMSTRKTNKSMEKWADIYDDNISIKYVEVAALLFESTIGGKAFNIPGAAEGYKIVSGEQGFGASPKMMSKIHDMQKLWGSLKNTDEFIKKFLQVGVYSTFKGDDAELEKMLEEASILTEWNKHRDNVPKAAKALTEAMKKDDPKAFAKAEAKLTSFMAACGEDISSIDSISSWYQLMSITGLFHGSTLSYTRLIIVPEIIRWRNIGNPEWDQFDYALMNTVFGTVQGMTLDRHVFTSSIEHGWDWDTEDISDTVMAVLDNYDSKAKDLKTDYTEELQNRDDLREFGWILTDHCNDGYDGKQHTITTYI
jgi:hypothetical protein